MQEARQGEKIARRQGAVSWEGAVRWRLWAPKAKTVELVLIEGDQQRLISMESEGEGYFRHVVAGVSEGQRYQYRLDGGSPRPDPASLAQPEGVHGPSAVVFPDRFAWSDHGWRGVRWEELVFYELHVGTFTREGTFDAIIPRLSQLKELGVTAIEIMPVGQFPGTRNWGYDGVLPYAAQNSYGGARGLQRLVDACHRIGMACFLDVVYNHFGPEGNYLGEFGPYFTDRYKTPWGAAVNYDGAGSDPVRDYVLDNARMWLEEFHLDGLRLDAVHAIFDLGARHLLRAFQEVAEDVSRRTGRPAYIVAESDQNDPRLLLPPSRGGYGLAGQWSDDFHHAVHVCLTGEKQGYYEDYTEPRHLASVLERPFLFAGDFSPCRGRKHGASPDNLSGDRFIVCVQNHDQVGNRASGDRIGVSQASPSRKRLAACLLLLSPHLPLLFMGEEYGEEAPFPFFCSFTDPELRPAVREGRRREFAAFAWQGEVPDPEDEATFSSARLSWSWPEGTSRAGLRRLYRDLLAARREWPGLRDFVRRTARLIPDNEAGPLLELVRGGDREVRAFFNLGGDRQPLPRPADGQKMLFRSEASRYSGMHHETGAHTELAAHECIVFGPASWRAVL